MRKRGDEAEDRFGAKFVADCRAVLRVGVIFFTFPMFWALFDQTVDGLMGFLTNYCSIHHFLHHRAVDLLSKPRQWMERSVQPHEQLILSEVALMSQCHFRSSSCLSKGAEGQAFTQPLTIYRMLNIWEIADICICLLDLGRICD